MATLTELTDATNALLTTVTTLSNQYTSVLEQESTTTGFLTDWDNTGRGDGEVPVWNSSAGKYQHAGLASVYETPAGAQAKADAAESASNGYTDTGLATKQATLSGASLASVTPAASDLVLIQDASDSNNLKTATAVAVADLAGSALQLIRTVTVSAPVASVEFDSTDMDGTYDEYFMRISKCVPDTDGANLNFRVSNNGGSTWITTGNYKRVAAGYTYGLIAGPIGSDVNEIGVTCGIWISDPHAAEYTPINLECVQYADTNGDSDTAYTNSQTIVTRAEDHNGFQLYYSSGNIESGVVSIYGLKRA